MVVDAPPLAPRQLALIALGLLGAAISTYLAVFQLRLLPTVWDPLFGAASSQAVLRSALSRSLPIPDALLGAVAYVLEVGLAIASRHSTWALLGLAVMLVGLSASGLVLLLLQVAVLHAACTLCLCSALISFVNVVLGRTEIATAARLFKPGGHVLP